MKILVVTDIYFPRVSGVTQIIDQTYSHLLKDKAVSEVTVLCKFQSDQDNSQNIVNGIKIKRFKNKNILGGRIMIPSVDMFRQVNQILNDFRPDQVHFHGRFSVVNPFALLVSKIKGYYTVHVDHMAGFVNGEKTWLVVASWFWDQTFGRFMMIANDRIVGVSVSDQKFLIQKLGAKKSKTFAIENGCAIEPSKTTFAQKFKRKKKFNLFYASRFVATKNPLLVVKAIDILRKNHPQLNFKLTLAGEGKLKNQVVDYIKNQKLEKYIDYVGKLPHSKMLTQFQKSDIFLNPTNIEGLPGGVLEALFNTNIVIVTDVGGNKDVIKTSCLRIPKKDLTATVLSKKIYYAIINSKKLIPSLQKNKDWAVDHFTWENVVRKYKKFILNKTSN